MAAPIEYISETLLEDKLVDLWLDYNCLYDVRSLEYKGKQKRDKTMEEIAASFISRRYVLTTFSKDRLDSLCFHPKEKSKRK